MADLLVVAGRRNGPRTATALGALVEQRAALLAPWAAERKVRIDVSGDGERGARHRRGGAREADNSGAQRRRGVAPWSGAVDVRVLDDDGAARVQVRDRGTGVDDARANELFEPFFTTKLEGTGLGLALSRAIAAAHGGTLTYAREEGMTRFELTFPAQRPAGVGARAEGAAADPGRAPMKAPPPLGALVQPRACVGAGAGDLMSAVLIVDDERGIREGLMAAGRGRGAPGVPGARSGRGAADHGVGADRGLHPCSTSGSATATGSTSSASCAGARAPRDPRGRRDGLWRQRPDHRGDARRRIRLRHQAF